MLFGSFGLHLRPWVCARAGLWAWRRDTTGLTLAEVRAVATVVGLVGGPTLISDDIPALTDERCAPNSSAF